MIWLRFSLLLLSLLPAMVNAGPIDNTVPPCDNDPGTAQPPCAMDDESIIVPPPMPNSDDSVVTPPAPVEEGVQEQPNTDIPPPMPQPRLPSAPEPDTPGLIPPPSPQARP